MEVLLAEVREKTAIQDRLLSLKDPTAYLSRSRAHAATTMAGGTVLPFGISFFRLMRRSGTDDYVESRLPARSEP